MPVIAAISASMAMANAPPRFLSAPLIFTSRPGVLATYPHNPQRLVPILPTRSFLIEIHAIEPMILR
jgi:hypothetical protein